MIFDQFRQNWRGIQSSKLSSSHPRIISLQSTWNRNGVDPQRTIISWIALLLLENSGKHPWWTLNLPLEKRIMIVLHHLLNIITIRICNKERQTSNNETCVVWVKKSTTRKVVYCTLFKIAGRQQIGCKPKASRHMNNVEDKCNLHAGGKTETNFSKISMTKIADWERLMRFTIVWIAVRLGFNVGTNIGVLKKTSMKI